MAINLANLNISLDQFQKMATGDYNAGEVALKSESKLTKINNHVHRLSANTKSISHESKSGRELGNGKGGSEAGEKRDFEPRPAAF